jgi:hypothetical protein
VVDVVPGDRVGEFLEGINLDSSQRVASPGSIVLNGHPPGDFLFIEGASQ